MLVPALIVALVATWAAGALLMTSFIRFACDALPLGWWRRGLAIVFWPFAIVIAIAIGGRE